MALLELKPTHKAVQHYYGALEEFDHLGVEHETAVRSAFQGLLDHCARQQDWLLVPEWEIRRPRQHPLRVDGALLDHFRLTHGFWEAKDSRDDLDREIKRKFEAGYPRDNILFQEPRRAVLFQQGQRAYEANLLRPEDLVYVLKQFIEYAPPAIADWERAVREFKDKVPELGASLQKLIHDQRQTNKAFIAAFAGFLSLCRGSLNPNLSEAAVEEMIIQHLLTERIFRKVFDAADFTQRNVIAQEIEKVVAALTSRAFSRDGFVKRLDHFYTAIEGAAATIHDFTEKQTFLNTVYERFFQGFSVKVADTHGIVYTPQPLVDFMVSSVEQVLKKEFGKSLADRDVHILDPFTGTGNFIVNIMRHIPKTALPHKYAEELHCNEVMLLPYYVASLNIEHAFYEATGNYEPFDGICLVDTFRTLEPPQSEFDFISEKNSERINRQRKVPIRVIIANPPYNAWQTDENDNNRNVTYGQIEKLVRETYGKDSQAQNKNSLSDPYIKAFRYASELVKDNGIIAYVSNGAFVESLACDGMRKNLASEFDLIYVLDLGGNVRKNPRLSGTTHNVFGIQVGVCITLLVKLPGKSKDSKRTAKILYHAVPVDWRRENKCQFLDTKADVSGVTWQELNPDKKHNWLDLGLRAEFDQFLPIGDRDLPKGSSIPPIFSHYSRGIATSRDDVAVNFSRECVARNMGAMIDAYNAQVDAYHRLKKKPARVEDFVDYESGMIAWSRDLKNDLLRHRKVEFEEAKLRASLYRPFARTWLFFDRVMNEEVYGFPGIFPNPDTQNLCLCVTDAGSEKPFMLFASDRIADLHLVGAGASTQCFPMFAFSEDGKDRRDNITPKALTLFQIFYADDGITREDIFHYVYALLHHPAYRARYAENLKRELPRIPFLGVAADVRRLQSPSSGAKKKSEPPHVGGYASFFPLSAIESMQGDAQPAHDPQASAKLFHALADAGRRLAELHVNYESAKEFPLKRVENSDVPLNWRVEAMKLSKDRTTILYNEFLRLEGIPPEVFDYRLGNRSALEWVIDQYRVTRDAQGEIASDPNRLDDEPYIVRLIGQVITVSLETLKIVRALPEVRFEAADSQDSTHHCAG